MYNFLGFLLWKIINFYFSVTVEIQYYNYNLLIYCIFMIYISFAFGSECLSMKRLEDRLLILWWVDSSYGMGRVQTSSQLFGLSPKKIFSYYYSKHLNVSVYIQWYRVKGWIFPLFSSNLWKYVKKNQ